MLITADAINTSTFSSHRRVEMFFWYRWVLRDPNAVELPCCHPYSNFPHLLIDHRLAFP